jgi:hypothetical protein
MDTLPLAPLAPPMGMATLPQGFDDSALSFLDDMEEPTPPRYRSWFQKPPKPSIKKILAMKENLDTDYIDRNTAIATTLGVIRGEVIGAFKEDVRDIQLGKKSGWMLTDLRDQYNAAVSTVASNKIIYNRKVYDPTQQAKSQIVEDAAYDLRARAERCWTERGDMPLHIAESKVLLGYGVLASRHTCDMHDPDYPFDSCLIDPAQVYPIWEGKRGLKQLVRCYKDKLFDVVFDYLHEEQLSAEIKKRLKNPDGEYEDVNSEPVDVIEYWDRWWNAVVLTDGTVIRPVTAHEYGIVPWVIAFGPGGETQFTNPQDYYGTKSANGAIEPYNDRGQNSAYKSTSIIADGIARNAQNEAVSGILVEELKKAARPPVVLERSTMAAKNPKRIVIDGGQNGVTETFLNEEKLSAFPTAPNPGIIQTLMQFIGKDAQSNGMNLSLLSQIQSNVSGAAVNAAADSGQYQLAPWTEVLANYHRMEFELKMEIWRNRGHYSRFMTDEPSKFLVADRDYKVRPVAELTPELLDEVGYEIDVRLYHMNVGQMLPLANGYKLLNDMGIMSKRTIAAEFGVTDYDRESHEWRDERSVDLAFQEPEFLKIITIPMALQQQIAALEGNPPAQALMQTLYDEWMTYMAQPAIQQQQMAAMQGGQQPGQPQAPPGMNPMGSAPGMAPGMMNPNGTQGVSFSGPMGQGPGSVSGVQGGPSGPMPPAPPPVY